METHNDRSNEQGENFGSNQSMQGHSVSAHNEEETAERLNGKRTGEKADAKPGDRDDLIPNQLDKGNTMGNDDNPAEARESGTR